MADEDPKFLDDTEIKKKEEAKLRLPIDRRQRLAANLRLMIGDAKDKNSTRV